MTVFCSFVSLAIAMVSLCVNQYDVKAFISTGTGRRKSEVDGNKGFASTQYASRKILGLPAFFRDKRSTSTLLLSVSGSGTTDMTPMSRAIDSTQSGGFIEDELRSAAMRLHTKSQAPREGEAPEDSTEAAQAYVPNLDDYLSFLVDSKHVYEAFEEVLQHADKYPGLRMFCNTGLERTAPLERDIRFLVSEYDLVRPPVGQIGLQYAQEIRDSLDKGEGNVPEFLCHYYNFYFAHTAGGRMIGKKMSSLLLNKKTLDFYKWDGDLNTIKRKVKDDIEALASSWARAERDACVAATGAAFRGGGAINSYLTTGRSRT